MEGYKTFTEALNEAHKHSSAWTSLSTGDYMSYEDMKELSVVEDMLFGLEADDYFLVLDDGAICLCSMMLKQISVLFRPRRKKRTTKPVGNKYCMKCGSPLRPGAKFCLKCGAKVVES